VGELADAGAYRDSVGIGGSAVFVGEISARPRCDMPCLRGLPKVMVSPLASGQDAAVLAGSDM